MSKVQIVEMSLRDGLQNEAVHISVAQRYQLTKKLAESGIRRIEMGAFVSPKWVPQMAESGVLARRLVSAKARGQLPKNLQLSALVPNETGLDNAAAAGIREVAIFGAASESFSQKNINVSIKDSFTKFEDVAERARAHKIKLRGYLSTVFGCPYEGKVSEAKVLRLIEKYLKLGVFEISLGDTIGVATPKPVRSLLKKVLELCPQSQVALHFHDTRGTAIANILASLDLGYSIFDCSLGGLGGCPYAPGAAGNVATEDVVYMLNGMGLKTGIQLEKLIKVTGWMNRQVGRQLPSKLSLAGV